VARKHGEESKVSVRRARHDALDLLGEIKQGGEASEDEVERAKKRAEEIVSEAGRNVDAVVQQREKDILAV
jgi:ribosome recycling factor